MDQRAEQHSPTVSNIMLCILTLKLTSCRGDSCHPNLPYLAQGSCSALEDAAVLGEVLSQIQTKADVPKALKTYEKLRKSRGELIVRETFKQVVLQNVYLVLPHLTDALLFFRGMISICPTGRNKRRETKFSSHSLASHSRERFQADGMFWKQRSRGTRC